MGKPATRLYTVYYNDGTYLSYNFTKSDYTQLKMAFELHLPVAETSVGLLAVRDVRSIILQRIKADVPQHQGASPDLPKEAQEWLKAANLAEKLLDEEELEGEADYEGGLIS
jgi:hypothetical protein